MSGQSIQTLSSDWILLPRAAASGTLAPDGSTLPVALNQAAPVTLAVSNAAQAVDLRILGGISNQANKQQEGTVGRYITISADGCDIYIIAGPTLASVTGANAPVARAVSTLTAGTGATTATLTTCEPVFAGSKAPFMPQVGRDNFLAFVTLGAATGFITLTQSAP